MTQRLYLILILLIGTTIPILSQKHESLKPLLIDLEGFEADPAEGMSMDIGDMNMITAARSYYFEGIDIETVIIIGNKIMMEAKLEETKIQTDEGVYEITEENGFKISKYYDENMGDFGLTVFLKEDENKAAIFAFTSSGLTPDEAMLLAKKFDWKKLKSAVKKLTK